MLGKLLKYDLKWIYKAVVVFYFLAFAFAVIARIFFSVQDSVLFGILAKITSSCAIAMMISSLINCLMRSWARFVRNIYKDESYLTHTLPVSKNTVYSSKVLSALICVFTTTAVIAGCLFVCYYSEENMQVLKSSLELAASAYDTTVLGLLLLILFVLFLEIMFVVLVGYAGIILGHKSNKNKMLKTIITGIALYLITQAVTLCLVYVFGLFNSDVMNLINTTGAVDISTIKSVMYAGIGIYVIYIIFYYLLGRKQFDKGVNVD